MSPTHEKLRMCVYVCVCVVCLGMLEQLSGRAGVFPFFFLLQFDTTIEAFLGVLPFLYCATTPHSSVAASGLDGGVFYIYT